ncbi:MAG: pertactin-like passenger domain-containing protein [Hyphomicrobiales bacterium]
MATLNQDAGDDTALLTGGTVGALSQGLGFDEAYINGGTITGQFLDGDYVEFAAGSIGDVDLTTAANIYAMWGSAAVVNNLNSESGADTFNLFGGSIGGTVSTGRGNDQVIIGGTQNVFNGATIPASTGATNVTGDIILEGGNDTLEQYGGTVSGDVYLDGGAGHTDGQSEGDTYNDTAILAGGTISGSVFADAAGGPAGHDDVTVDGTTVVGDVDLGNGNNFLTMDSGSIGGNATSGTGVDTATINGGAITGALDIGSGDDIAHLNGGTIGGGVVTGAGEDEISIAGTAVTGSVDAGADNDQITLSGGSVSANILGGTGDDQFVWSAGTMAGFMGGDGSDTATVTSATYDGTQLLDGGDDTATADGFTDKLDLNGLNVTSTGAKLLNWEELNLNSTDLLLSDNTLAAGTIFVNLGGELESAGNLSVTGNVQVAAGGTWTATSGGAVSGNLVNAGTVDLQDGVVGDTVTVTGNYTGGGQLKLDADTGAGTADLLAITGNVTGPHTTIALNNLSVSGSYTGDGPDAGIALVSVGGTTAANDFALAGGPFVAGGFLYGLSLESDGTFYLQSTIRGEAVASSTLGVITGDVGRAFIGTRHERVGEQERSQTSNMWGRAIGEFSSEEIAASGVGAPCLWTATSPACRPSG